MKVYRTGIVALSIVVAASVVAQEEPVNQGATELSPSRSEYFSWINNTNEGATEAQTLINLEFFRCFTKSTGCNSTSMPSTPARSTVSGFTGKSAPIVFESSFLEDSSRLPTLRPPADNSSADRRAGRGHGQLTGGASGGPLHRQLALPVISRPSPLALLESHPARRARGTRQRVGGAVEPVTRLDCRQSLSGVAGIILG